MKAASEKRAGEDGEEPLILPVACHPRGVKSWKTLERWGMVLGSLLGFWKTGEIGEISRAIQNTE